MVYFFLLFRGTFSSDLPELKAFDFESRSLKYSVLYVCLQERVPDPGPDQQIRLGHGGGGRGQEPEDLQPRAGACEAGAAGARPQAADE